MSSIRNFKIDVRGHKNYKVQVESYDSAMEVADKCNTRSLTSDRFEDMRSKCFGGWDGVSSYDEAIDLLRNGYQPIVEDMRGEFKSNRTGIGGRFKFQNAVAGFAPVVPLAMMGVPNSMIDMRMKPIKTKVIDVYYDMTCSCGTTSEEIIENGKKLLGAIIELEAQGYRFNLYAVQTYCDKTDADMLVVKVKSSTQPLDLKRISFPLCHTAFFRVIGFDWYSKVPNGTYRIGYGHAAYHEFHDDMNEFYRKLFGQNSVCFSRTAIMNQGKEHIKEVMVNDSKNR